MATKGVYTVREDKKGLQKQLGCMNGIFHLLDRGYLLGLHHLWRNHNRVITATGQGENGERGLKKSSKKAKDKIQKKMTIEKKLASVESSRSWCSSSCPSTTLSSFDCGKRVQNEWQLPSEPTSPNLHKKQPEWSLPPLDIRDLVKESMTRAINVTKDERTGLSMKHDDSPRPFMHQNSTQYDRKDQNLAKIQKKVKIVKDTSRYSCDERESKYSLESGLKVKEFSRLSLDSRQNSNPISMDESRREPGSHKRPTSGVVARLMGLDTLSDSLCEVETVKIKLAFGDQPRLPTVKGTSSQTKREFLNGAVKPAMIATEPVMATGVHRVKHTARKQAKDSTPRRIKASDRKPKSLQDLTGERPISSPRLQRSKNGIDNQCINGPPYDSSRIKKQSNLKTKHLKIKPINPMHSNDQLCMPRNETRNLCQDAKAVSSRKSESKQEVTRVSENNFAEKLIEGNPMIEVAKLTMEQVSPISVIDAFYVEDTPSPVNKKPNAFNDYKKLRIDETEWKQAEICDLVTRSDGSEFHQVKLYNTTNSEIEKSPCKSTNGDLILEKTNDKCHKVRRKLIFDSVNEIIFHKLGMSGISRKRCGEFVDEEKLLTELWLETNNIRSGCLYDKDDEVKMLLRAYKDGDRYCNEVYGLVLDIERLVFKDLIDEIVYADAAGAQDQLGRQCRRVFSM